MGKYLFRYTQKVLHKENTERYSLDVEKEFNKLEKFHDLLCNCFVISYLGSGCWEDSHVIFIFKVDNKFIKLRWDIDGENIFNEFTTKLSHKQVQEKYPEYYADYLSRSKN